MKIILRPLKISDAKISYKWRNDPNIWKYTGNKPDKYITYEIEKKWLECALKNNNEKRFAICIDKDEKYIGNIQFTNIEKCKAQFHIFIGDKEYWDKGIATIATKLLLNIGFNSLALREIYLYVNKNNKAAIHVYIKNGFHIEKEMNDQYVMVITNE